MSNFRRLSFGGSAFSSSEGFPLHVRVRIGEQVVYADNRANGASPSLWLETMPIEIPVSTILVLILLAQKIGPPFESEGPMP